MSELSPITLLDVDGQPFGHSLALRMRRRKGLSPSIQEQARVLRANVETLVNSPSTQHVSAVKTINQHFRRNDQETYDKTVQRRQKMDGEGVLEWLAGASDKQLVAFAKWNVERTRTLTAQLAKDKDSLVETAFEKTTKLIDLDFFPRDALRRVSLAAKEYTPFQAMDSFESGAMWANGYFDKEFISLANLYTSDNGEYTMSSQLQETSFHELLHATGYSSGQGFHFNDTPVDARIWEEAFVSHSVSVAFTPENRAPQLDTYDPLERIGGARLSYAEERRAMGYVSSADISNIPADLWAAAYFDRTDQRNQHTLARKLRLGFQALMLHEDGVHVFHEAYEQTWSDNNRKERSALLAKLENRVYEYRGDNTIFEDIEDDAMMEADTSWIALRL